MRSPIYLFLVYLNYFLFRYYLYRYWPINVNAVPIPRPIKVSFLLQKGEESSIIFNIGKILKIHIKILLP